jgi:hypothetical protein
MKKIVLILVFAVAGLLAFNYVRTGEVTLIPAGSATAEGRQLDDLADRFEAARKQYGQAGRTAGLSGMDTTSDADAALRTVHDVEKALGQLKAKLQSDSADGRKAEKLAAAIGEFTRQAR